MVSQGVAGSRSWRIRADSAVAVYRRCRVSRAASRVPFRKTHSLEELGAQCEAVDGELKPVIDKAVPLTKYAWEFRYPGESEAPSPEEAQAALAMAREVYDAV